MKILSAKLAVIAFTAVSAIGCAGANLREAVDELTREREDLQRRNSMLEGQLAASEARASALEREVSAKRASTKDDGGDVELPAGLREKGVGLRQRGGDTVLDLPSDVFFASGSATLSKDGGRTLAQVIDLVKKSAHQSMIRVEGHADSDPIRRTRSKYHCNWELSFQRAHAVVHFMIEKGIDPRQLACDCYGEYQPQDPRNKARNRRVEIVISRGP
ncbi:MAG: OmpA family protein [Planctomycetes bacterium]|nr:OmpA family protein [Planctomycetota bacterium]